MDYSAYLVFLVLLYDTFIFRTEQKSFIYEFLAASFPYMYSITMWRYDISYRVMSTVSKTYSISLRIYGIYFDKRVYRNKWLDEHVELGLYGSVLVRNSVILLVKNQRESLTLNVEWGIPEMQWIKCFTLALRLLKRLTTQIITQLSRGSYVRWIKKDHIYSYVLSSYEFKYFYIFLYMYNFSYL